MRALLLGGLRMSKHKGFLNQNRFKSSKRIKMEKPGEDKASQRRWHLDREKEEGEKSQGQCQKQKKSY